MNNLQCEFLICVKDISKYYRKIRKSVPDALKAYEIKKVDCVTFLKNKYFYYRNLKSNGKETK